MNTPDLKITNKVPVPRAAGGSKTRWPFEKMRVGDSFFVPEQFAGPTGNIIRPAAAGWKRRHPDWNYTTRTEEGGMRVWRIATGGNKVA